MNGFRGLGENPIKVSLAIPKHKLIQTEEEKDNPQYSYLYESYMADRGAWGNHGTFNGPSQQPVISNGIPIKGDSYAGLDFLDEEDATEDRIIDHNVPVNVDAMNAEFVSRSNEVWDGVEKDRWIYNLDNHEDGICPVFRHKI